MILALAHRLVGIAALLDQSAQLLELLEDGPLGLLLRGLARLGVFLLRFFVEQLALRDLTSLDAIGELQQVRYRKRLSQNLVADIALTGLDLLGNFDFLFARQEGDRAHLLEVHAHRVGGVFTEGLLFALFLDPLVSFSSSLARVGSAMASTDSTSISPSIEIAPSISSAGAASWGNASAMSSKRPTLGPVGFDGFLPLCSRFLCMPLVSRTGFQ